MPSSWSGRALNFNLFRIFLREATVRKCIIYFKLSVKEVRGRGLMTARNSFPRDVKRDPSVGLLLLKWTLLDIASLGE